MMPSSRTPVTAFTHVGPHLVHSTSVEPGGTQTAATYHVGEGGPGQPTTFHHHRAAVISGDLVTAGGDTF